MTKICPRCENKTHDHARFCPRCGFNFDQKVTSNDVKDQCPNCRIGLRPNAKFCPSCGTRIKGAGFAKMKHLYAPEGVRHSCAICKNEIDMDLIFCPSCVNPFHYNHLINWLLQNPLCPICRTTLEIID